MLLVFRAAAAHAADLFHFDFGPPADPSDPLESFLRWVLDDYPARYEEQWRRPGVQSVRTLARFLVASTSDDDTRDILVAMGRYFQDWPAKALLTFLAHQSPGIRAAATRALGRAGLYDSVPALGRMLDDADPDVRLEAVYALGLSEHLSALPLLDRAAAKEPHLAPHVQTAKALVTAGAKGDNLESAKIQLASDEWEDATRIALVDSPAIPELLADRKQPPQLRARAACVLGRGLRRASATELLPRITDPAEDREVRLAAIEAMGRVGTSSSSTYVVPFVDDADPEIQEAAVTAIGRLRDEDQVPLLLSKWNVRGGALRPHITTAIRRIFDDPGAQVLSSRPVWHHPQPAEFIIIDDSGTLHRRFEPDLVRLKLSSPDARARRDAGVLLAYFGDSSDVRRLEGMYQNDPERENRWVGAIGVREMRARGL